VFQQRSLLFYYIFSPKEWCFGNGKINETESGIGRTKKSSSKTEFAKKTETRKSLADSDLKCKRNQRQRVSLTISIRFEDKTNMSSFPRETFKINQRHINTNIGPLFPNSESVAKTDREN
jgi:hypothetical protein